MVEDGLMKSLKLELLRQTINYKNKSSNNEKKNCNKKNNSDEKQTISKWEEAEIETKKRKKLLHSVIV